jgi:2-polyprenyl-6-methoxyphenol hydroxylase-like FAD-dependent oxidoreductase
MKPASPTGSHAVVVGGSVAGLLAARVLADHFERVTVVERDRFPATAAPRPGVPQARHQHVLLERGRRVLERLFPGLQAELVEAGAPVLDMGADVAWLTPAGWGVRFPSSLPLLACSRDLLEWGVRRRLGAQPEVSFMTEADVVGLVPTPEGRGVAGVFVRSRGEAGRTRRLEADVVIDASGRESRAPRWLEALGCERPEETVVNASLGYASRVYRRAGQLPAGVGGVYVQAAPPEVTRGGVAFPLEGGRFMVTLVGLGGDHPPTHDEGFLAFAGSLRSPLIHDAIAGNEPDGPISSSRATVNRWRHYERLARGPERFLVLGDAACAFNPVYAQGMTTAAIGADLLDRVLDEGRGDPGLGRRFQAALARANSSAWMLATGEDARVRGAVGVRRSRGTRFLHRYMDEVMRLTTRDAAVRRVFLEAFHLLRSPAALFAPWIVARVVRQLVLRGGGVPCLEPPLADSRLV